MLASRRSFLTTLASTAFAARDNELAAMDRVVETFMQAHAIPGMSVAVAHEGELLHQKAYGFADRSRGEKATTASLFRIASVSKPITSVAIFQLIEQGKLRLDGPVFGPRGTLGNDYGSPPYQPFVADLRLRHLLTHTGGGWQNDGDDPMFRKPSMNHHDLIAWTLANHKLTHAPGTHYAYSNFGYCVLGRIVEKAAGRPYEQHVREAVLAPCGVDDMWISGNTLADRAPGEVVYYGADHQNPYDMNVRRMDSHGGWLASAASLVKFASHVDGFSRTREILRPDSISAMTTATAANQQYACGWAVNKVPNWWHTGSLPGATSILVRTASGYCWSALLNSREAKGDTGGALDEMMWQMVRQVKSWKT